MASSALLRPSTLLFFLPGELLEAVATSPKRHQVAHVLLQPLLSLPTTLFGQA